MAKFSMYSLLFMYVTTKVIITGRSIRATASRALLRIEA